MIGLEVREARIFVRPRCTDMRKQINGLAVIVEQVMQASVFEPALFLFCNGKRRILNALYWEIPGFQFIGAERSPFLFLFQARCLWLRSG